MKQKRISTDEKANGAVERASSGSIRSVEKAIDILDLLAREGTGVRLGDVAERLGMSPSTVHHLLATLRGRGLVAQDERSKTYRIGHRLIEMGRVYVAESQIYPAAIGPVEDLRDRSGETTYLAVFQEREYVTALALAGSRPLQARRVPRPAGTNLHSTASGKLFLAFMSEPVRERILSTLALTPFTPHTLTDRAALLAELATIAEQGFALDREEDFVGLRCIAAPVLAADGACVAAVSVSYPAAPEARTNELVVLVREAAVRISANLGHGDGSAR
jgi:DNA-binding IclR family transcriptional regulator